MSTLKRTLALGLALASFAMAARADDTGDNPDRAARREAMQARLAQHFAQRQAKLHDLLKLTSQQEAAWSSYQAALQPSATPPVHPDRAAFKAMSAPDRLQAALDLSRQREAKMEAHLAALRTFYAALTPDQQTVFNSHTMGGEWGGGRMGHHLHRG